MEKKILYIIILSLCVFLFLGCNKKVVQTNEELRVYIGYGEDYVINATIAVFKARYPEVQVNLIKADSNIDIYEEANRMAVELMAGKGADVFFVQPGWDVNKMAQKKVFADLASFYDNDEFFQADEWNHKVLDGACSGEYRYAIPIEYGIPVLTTSKTALEESGINLNNLLDFHGFMSETEKYMNHNNSTRRLFRMEKVPRQALFWGGYEIIDIEQSNVDLEGEDIENYFKWYKQVEQQSIEDNFFDDYAGAAAIRDKEVLFENQLGASPYQYLVSEIRAISSFDDPIMVPVRNLDGGITARIMDAMAVRSNSPNQQNAYNFIKCILSDEVQKMSLTRRSGGVVVNNRLMDEVYFKREANLVPAEASGGFPKELPSFTEEQHEEFMAFTKEINRASFYPTVNSMLIRNMMSYIQGQKSYEDAAGETKREVELYLSE